MRKGDYGWFLEQVPLAATGWVGWWREATTFPRQLIRGANRTNVPDDPGFTTLLAGNSDEDAAYPAVDRTDLLGPVSRTMDGTTV